MFIWEYNAIFAVVVFLSFGVVFVLWVAYTLIRAGVEGEPKESVYFRQCPFCVYVYMDYYVRTPGHCPRCLSYHD